MSRIDRRTACRYLVDIDCKVRFKHVRNVVELPAKVKDVSTLGSTIHVAHAIDMDAVVALFIAKFLDSPLYCRVEHCERFDAHHYAVGLHVVEGSIPVATFRKMIGNAEIGRLAPAVPECFQALGIPFPSTEKAVHKAFRIKAMKAHPDHGGDPSDFVALYASYREALKLCT